MKRLWVIAVLLMMAACGSDAGDGKPSSTFTPQPDRFADATASYFPGDYTAKARRDIGEQICTDLTGAGGYDSVQASLTSSSGLTDTDAAQTTRQAVRYICPEQQTNLPS